jgi:hypothetical protein
MTLRTVSAFPLYHVSAEPLALGPQPPLQPRRWNVASHEEVEDLLETMRPSSAPARRVSYFSFPTLGQCAAYAGAGDGLPAVLRYYRASMSASWRAPMTLMPVPVDSAHAAERLAREYWEPTVNWNFWEYFGLEMTVEEEVPPPNDGEVPLALTWVIADWNRMRQLAAAAPPPN